MSEKGKGLSAKQYLSQLAVIDEQITQNIERLEQMKHQACGVGAINYDKERVQTSTSGDRLCADVTRYVEFDRRINDEIDAFVDAKEQIIREIRGLHDKQYLQVLYKVYVEYKSLKTAAFEMGRSYQYAREVHKKALIVFGETYKNLQYLT